jgi:hypothetical protein
MTQQQNGDVADAMAEAAKRHADLILRASGSGLQHYTMKSTRDAILMAVMDCYEEAYRAGVARALQQKAA